MKLDCLLIHVPKFNSFYNLFGNHIYCMYMSMGLFAIADCVSRKNRRVQILHMGIEKIKNPAFSLQEYIKETGPEIIGLSLHWHHQSYDVIKLAEDIKDANPHILTVLGGFTASYFHGEIMRHFDFIDAVIRGDGELPFAELAVEKTSAREKGFSGIPNLTWRDKNGGVVENKMGYAASGEDLDRLNFTNLRFLKNYGSYVKYAKNPFVWINNKRINNVLLSKNGYFPLCITRGCDVDCSFCGGSASSCGEICKRTKTVRRSAEKIVDSIREIKTYGYDCVFIDIPPVFADDPGYIERLFEEIKKQGVKIGCAAAYRSLPSQSALEIFKNTFDISNSKILLSPETGSEEIRKLNKGNYFSNDLLFKTVKQSTGFGIHTEIYFLLGLPFETPATLKIMKELQQSLKERFGGKISIYTDLLALEPGSPMYVTPERYRIVKTCDSFMDFYHIHSGENSCSWSTMGYYSEDFSEEGTELDKNRYFKKELKKINCGEFCKLSAFLTSSWLKKTRNKTVIKTISKLSRLSCKIMEYYWKYGASKNLHKKGLEICQKKP